MKEQMTELFNIKQEIKLIKSTRLKPLEERAKELEVELLGMLEEQGTDSSRLNGIGSVTKTELVVPQAEDWTAFYEYVQSTGSFHLLNRALNAAAFRETLQSGEDIPGLVPFTKVSLSVRKAA